MAVQDLKGPELQKLLDYYGSQKRFKDALGINEKTLRAMIGHYGLTLKKLDKMDPVTFTSELARIGSIELFAVIWDCKISEVRQRAQEISQGTVYRYRSMGSKSGIGALGESYFKEIRGQMIAEDCHLEQPDGNTHPYDFRDLVYGLVNVKTASRRLLHSMKYRNDREFWHFNTHGFKDSDFLALVPLDRKGQPIKVIMIDSKTVGERFPGKITITGKDLTAATSSMQNDLSQPESRREYLLLPNFLSRYQNTEEEIEQLEAVQSVCEEIPE